MFVFLGDVQLQFLCTCVSILHFCCNCTEGTEVFCYAPSSVQACEAHILSLGCEGVLQGCKALYKQVPFPLRGFKTAVQ